MEVTPEGQGAGRSLSFAVATVLNAVFVIAPKDRLAELKSLPGVKGVVPLRRYHRELNRATQLLNGPAAWNTLGGVENAGRGIKIAVLDSGIDQTHPAFQDSSLPMPGGYLICSDGDCAFTNSKVIVARSYVRQLAAGSAQSPAADSRPDDYSPRDRDGHGTAVASCAADAVNTGHVTFFGLAPKAYLGNYKIYGSPGLNDGTTDDVIIQALEDAFRDGMDIVTFSSGGPAFTGPLDSGAACGNSPGVPCDLVAQAFETVARKGMAIVAGGCSFRDCGRNNVPTGAIAAAIRDVTQLGNDGLACSPLPAGSLVGSIALIERGTCTFPAKLASVEDAGAVGAIFHMDDQSPTIAPGGLSSFPIPAVMISNSDGLALKSFADVNPGHPVIIDPAGIEQSAVADQLAGFSSVGPATGGGALKPDLLVVGTNLYRAGESDDPAGVLYGFDRYAVADGTSFSTLMIAGAAALVEQRHPEFTPDQVKSALMNTAASTVTIDDGGNTVDVRSTGAWAGFTTQDRKRCQMMARITALVYNWWTIFMRLGIPDQHAEAVTSRPLALHGIARRTRHSNQTTVEITSTHSKAGLIEAALTRVSGFLQRMRASAEQLTSAARWRLILSAAFRHFLRGKILGSTGRLAEATG